MLLKDLDKLTVVKLRAELIARGLDSKGNKPFLVERLRIALEEEQRNGGAVPSLQQCDAVDRGTEDESLTPKITGLNNGSYSAPDELVPATDVQNEQEVTPENVSAETDNQTACESEVKISESSASAAPEDEPENLVHEDEDKSASRTEECQEESHQGDADESLKDSAPEENLQDTDKDLKDAAPDEALKDATPDEALKDAAPDDSIMAVYGGKDETMTEDSILEQPADNTGMSVTNEPVNEHAPLNNSKDGEEPMEESAPLEENVDETKADVDAGETEAEIPKTENAEIISDTSKDAEKSEEKNERGTKRQRDRSSSPVNKPEETPLPEDEPEWEADKVLLDWYNSDLNLVINKSDFTSAHPMADGGFAYMWAGVRATYGFINGKICFQVKVTENIPVPHLEESEPNPHVVRVGWSVDSINLQLGEDELSCGYGGTGKISNNSEFKDYGVPFQLNDVVGVYLDASEGKETVEISFTVNGEPQGLAFSLTREELNGRALFPHILTKNCRFEVDFGQKEDHWFPPLEGYEWADKTAIESRVRGLTAPATRADCQMIMMCGLPGCGKTTWANKFARENPDSKYNIIGTNAFLEKMKVNGLARRKNYNGRWEILIEKCTRCLNILLDVAAKRRRNYILDQTNVYPTAQKRKMSLFLGFKRKAVVIVPTEEEGKARNEKRIQEEGKDVPETAVMEMKANFKIPSVDETFAEVDFPELPRDEAQKVIDKYSTEAKAAGYGLPSPKRQRQNYPGSNNRGKNDRGNDSRRHNPSGGGRDRNRDSRSSYNHRSSAGGSSSRTNYRNSRDDRHRPPPSHWRGGGGGGPIRGSGWSNRGPPPPPMHNRNGPYSPRRGPPMPPGPMMNRGGWSAPPLDRSYGPGPRSGGGGRSYDDRRSDRPAYSAPRRDGGGPSPWMSSPSVASSAPPRSSWSSPHQQPWTGSSSSSYGGQSQQSSYASGGASYGGASLYGSTGNSRPATGGGVPYGGAASSSARPVVGYGSSGAGITGLARPASYGSNGPSRAAPSYSGGASSLPSSGGNRPSSYGSGAPGRPISGYSSTNSWSQQQAPTQPQSGYQHAYSSNHSTYGK